MTTEERFDKCGRLGCNHVQYFHNIVVARFFKEKNTEKKCRLCDCPTFKEKIYL